MNRLRFECTKCLLKKLDQIPEGFSEEKKMEYAQQVLKILAEAPLSTSAPVITWKINELKNKLFGLGDEYTELKLHFNDLMLSLAPAIEKKIMAHEDPLLEGIRYALIGNYIDFGAMKHVKESELRSRLNQADNLSLDAKELGHLKENLGTAKNLLYLTDNCGEVVMDKLLIKAIKRAYPQLDVTVMVRGMPILNDATMEDARQVGLAEIATVMDNGTGVAGSCYEMMSKEAQAAMDGADVIISKGQGNFETLRLSERNIFYLFLCKCEMFAHEFSVPEMTGILISDSGYAKLLAKKNK